MLAWDIAWIVIPLLLGGFATLLAAVSAWSRQYLAGSKTFVLFMLVMAWWGFNYLFELSALDLSRKLLFAKLQYLAIPNTAPMLLLLVANVIGFKFQHKWWFRTLLFAVAVLTNIILWTRTDLIWRSIGETSVGNTVQFTFEYGPWFFIQAGYSYFIFVVAFLMTLYVALRSPRLSTLEGSMLLGGALVPFISNLLYVLNINLVPGIDLTPLTLTTFGLVVGWSLYEFRLGDLMPVAYRAAFASLPDTALLVDADDRVQVVNAAAEVYFARSLGELHRLPITVLLPESWVGLVDLDDNDDIVNLEVSRQDGEDTYHFDLRVTAILDRRRRYKGRLFVIRDITVRKQAEISLARRKQELTERVEERTGELRSANQKLLRAVRSRDEFLASMSHELRTPLSAVIGTAEALREQVYGPLSATQYTPLTRIEDSANHLLALINDILDVAKIEAGNFKLRVGPISIAEMCHACVGVLAPTADQKQLKIATNYQISQRIIVADERRVRQILINLLSNAVKFTPENGRVGLSVGEDADKQLTYFTVWDTGIGVSPADQKRIFRPFVQLDSSLAREHEGAGLGLALSISLAQMHGGSISVKSEEGRGSRFTVIMPWDSRITATAPFEEMSAYRLGAVV